MVASEEGMPSDMVFYDFIDEVFSAGLELFDEIL